MAALRNTYLVLYNVTQCCGWFYLLVTLLPHLGHSLIEGKDDGRLYRETGALLRLLCTAAVLEIAHAACGLVKSNPVITGFQVVARLFVTWAILHCVPEAQTCRGFPLLLLAFSTVEIIRYPFYGLSVLGIQSYIVTWLRYTAFIILYPMGAGGELVCYFNSLARVKSTGLHSVQLPNSYNITFNFYYVLLAIMILYIPMFPVMYSHMFVQRKKFFAKEADKRKSQ